MAAGQSGSPPPPAIAVIGVVFPLAVWTTVTGSASPDALTVVLVLFVTGALSTLAATAIFRTSERRARDRGLLDRTTGS